MTQDRKPASMLLVLLVVGGLAAGGGFWLGRRPATQTSAPAMPTGEAQKKERKLLYYRNPM